MPSISFPRRLPPLAAYSLAFVSVAISVFLRYALTPVLGTADPYATFYWAVLAAALAGGFWPGLLCTVLSAASAVFWFIEPVHSFRTSHVHDAVATILFVSTGSVASFLCAALRDAMEASALSAVRSRASAREVELARERERNILESIGDGFIAFDPQWRISFINERGAQILGRRRAELVGTHIVSLYPSRVLSEAYPKLHRALGHRQTLHFEFQVETTGQWFGASAYAFNSGVSLFLRDVTESRRLAAAVRDSEERFRIMAESAPLNIWTDTWEGNRDYVNNRFLAFTGRTLPEEMGRGWRDRIHPDDRERVARIYDAAAEAQIGFTIEYRLLHADGEYRWMLDSGAPRLSPRGDYLGSVGSCLDITQRRQAEESLRESVAQLELSLSVSQMGAWSHDVERGEIVLSPELERIFGVKAEASRNSRELATRLVQAEDLERLRQSMFQVYQNGGECECEVRLIREDGQTRWLLIRGRGILDASGRCTRLVGVGIDITQRKQLEERVQHAQKLESLGVLAGGIAHDFNNLLTGILGGSTMVLDDLEPGSLSWTLQRNVIEASERAAQLTGQMLAYSGRGHFTIETVDLAKLVRDNFRLMQASIQNKKVELALRVGSERCLVDADPAQLQQIVMNLVLNAAEAIALENAGTVSVSLSHLFLDGDGSDLTPGDYIVLKVSDTGAGMDESTMSRIFDPFFTTKFAGRGLGLAAVQGIVRSHKGKIRVESRPGAGSTFEVVLPRAKGAPPQSQPETRSVWRGAGAVLVAEHEEVVRSMVQATLERFGYSVVIAENGLEAVRLFEENPAGFSAVLLDMNMPVMNGEETLGRLKKIRQDVKVIVCSGYSETEAVQRFARHGMDAFIQKPYNGSQLAEKVRAVCAAA